MRVGGYFLGVLLLVACRDRAAAPAPPAPSSSSATVVTGNLEALRSAEWDRNSAAIGADALSSRDVRVRRAAARALSRIADARANELLSLGLADEDAEVVTWSAYGLGYSCKGREPKTVRALVTRAASWSEGTDTPLWFTPSEAIADALGRCGSNEAESTLRAWLTGPTPRAEAAALAIGRIATQRGQLADETRVALLDAADGDKPLQNALYPFTRLHTLNESTSARLRERCLSTLPKAGVSAEFAVRALSQSGEHSSDQLAQVIARADASLTVRAEAARELASLGPTAEPALWTAFNALPTAPSDGEIAGAAYGPLSAVIDSLLPPVASSAEKLIAFAELPLGSNDSPSLKRRKVHLRCQAAALLAGSNDQSPRLLACDPESASPTRDLARLRVLGREALRGRRKQAYLAILASPEPRVREAALSLLGRHPEVSDAPALLAAALADSALGVVVSAAQLLTSYPERANLAGAPSAAPNPDPQIIKALSAAYPRARQQNAVEVQAELIDALGALQILSEKAAIASDCASPNPTLREHAEKALHLLGEQHRSCDHAVVSHVVLPPALDTRQLLSLETDAGPLSLILDPGLAPGAVTRIVALAQGGFYDGLSVHRVVPGFVVQFGDPHADGYGGDEKPPLRCETSPAPFRAASVGIALSGRDTGSSQWFVTLGRYPHLDGEYALIGTASAGWDALAEGDRITHVRVSAAP